ncbi:MAG TPA: NADP-dependent oxidoreductase [Stellaceae bacterium]|nr:NADP-dependent oxidoreductase [Stellaceae bacterium]
MLPKTHRQVRLKSRPVGIPEAHHFEIVAAPLAEPAERQFVVHNEFLSVEPAMRGWVNAVANYSTPVAIGAVMRSYTAGEVVASRHPGFKEGDRVMGQLGWQEYAASDGAGVRKVRETDLPLSLSLGVLGLNGRTAYFGLLDVGEPRPGDTVVVSTAAGSVGSAVGQIAKLMGCRTVGIAGGSEKVKLCRDAFGYDAAIDYKAAGSLSDAVAASCPGGVNVYYDNTSGAISDAVLPHLAVHARVVICGTASVANWDPPPLGPRVERHLLVKRARMQGIVVFDYAHRDEEAVARLAAWVREGKLRYREEILEGLEACPDAIAGLYRGENLGKRVIRLAQG